MNIHSLNDINTKKTNFVLTNNIEDIFSFTESGIIFYDDDFNVHFVHLSLVLHSDDRSNDLIWICSISHVLR